MIRIKSNTRVEISRLFACLQFGERVAQNCALHQAMMNVDKRSGLFLTRQALQEANHEKIFGRVISIITPRRTPDVPISLLQFSRRLEDSIRNRHLLDTLIGQQIVLEGFGELILHRMNKKFDQRHIGFKRLRRTVLHQEQGHQAFGERSIRSLVDSGNATLAQVRSLTLEYLQLIDQLLVELQPMFGVVGADAGQYKIEVRQRIPDWIVGEGS